MTIKILCATAMVALVSVHGAHAADPFSAKLHPNLAGQLSKPLRYTPDGDDFVIQNGEEFFNRSLYGGHTAFRVDGGDKSEFTLYLPGRGGNLRLGVETTGGTKWLKDAANIVTRYRPGELIYEIRDPEFGDQTVVTLDVLAYASTEGLVVRTTVAHAAKGTKLFWAYGGVNGQRGSRDGDIGTEKVPISQYFQLQPSFATGNDFALAASGFTLTSPAATIAGAVPAGSTLRVVSADDWNDASKLLGASTTHPHRPVVVGEADASNGHPLYLSLQNVGAPITADLQTYKDVTTQKRAEADAGTKALQPAYATSDLPKRFDEAKAYFDRLRSRVRIDTPDPYLNASVGALNIAADALWDDHARAIMHGAIAWRTPLLGWRGPYALDDLGTHDRARQNFDTWLPRQNSSAIATTIPPPDASANLSRNEAGLHSNGDLSGSHYDMNQVFIDALFRHLLWTGDAAYARKVWPIIECHIAWEKRLFRREYGPDKLPLYEAYADIWASDGLYYSGAGTAYASAYNLYANRMAARLAPLAGTDPAPYTREADAIAAGMRQVLWMPDRGAFAETKDVTGNQLLHPDYGLWTFYHTVDEEAASPREAWEMAEDLMRHLPSIPVAGPGVPNDRPYHVYAETDWMPYTWSDNNVVMDENSHTALAMWQGGHADEAYTLLKGAILSSQYLGISPGNLGTMQYLDVYRRESQRDFGDSAGTLSRAIIEGLFGVHPDALAHRLTISPGFPANWDHARLDHPDVGIAFRRSGTTDTWAVRRARPFRTVTLIVPAVYDGIARTLVNGKTTHWQAVKDAIGRPQVAIVTNAGPTATIEIHWAGKPINIKTAVAGPTESGFVQRRQGAFAWWTMAPKPSPAAPRIVTAFDWNAPRIGQMAPVDLSQAFNDSVTKIFTPGKYLSPRPQGVSLALPSQGYGEWTHPADMPAIDDSGLRQAAAQQGGKITMPDGVVFATSGDATARNIAFTSQWDNYPHEVSVPLSGKASHLYLLMAGSTNHQQSRIDNGEVIVTYADGTTTRLALRNPETWWPIDEDYFIDDYQFQDPGPLPARIDLKTGRIRVLDMATFKGSGHGVPGGAATALQLALDPAKELKSLSVRTIANDIVIGLMSATLERPIP